jgi:acyl dehydratase
VTTSPDTIRFDDLAALGALGSEFDAFGPAVVVSQAMIDAFAALTGDRQWIHVDVERCQRESALGTTVAHGYLLVSLLPALLPMAATSRAIVGFGKVINYGLDELRFLGAVPAGSEVQARRRIVHVRKKGRDGTQITFEVEMWLVGGEAPVLRARLVAIFLP